MLGTEKNIQPIKDHANPEGNGPQHSAIIAGYAAQHALLYT